MKRTNELIRIAEGYEPADSPFMKEGTDTGYPIKLEDLCEECKETALIKTNTL